MTTTAGRPYYNGFSHEFANAATRYGDGFPAARGRWVPSTFKGCAACGETRGSQWWHNEDYRMPLDSFVVCPWCHWTIHQRVAYRDVFLAWCEKVGTGWRPLLAPRGVKIADWREHFAVVDPLHWEGSAGPGVPDSLLDLLPDTIHELAPHLAVADGAPHHRRQWRTEPPVIFAP